MPSKKTGKQKKPGKTPNGRKRPRVIFIMITIIVMAVVAGMLFFGYSRDDIKGQPVAEDGNSRRPSADSPAAAPKNIFKLVGRWLRPDGGYVIEIANADAAGALEAAYFNPRPINVAQASWASEEGRIQIFIELRDVGYPGARYSLAYDPQDDALKGLYYQPLVEQSFEVVFVRMNS